MRAKELSKDNVKWFHRMMEHSLRSGKCAFNESPIDDQNMAVYLDSTKSSLGQPVLGNTYSPVNITFTSHPSTSGKWLTIQRSDNLHLDNISDDASGFKKYHFSDLELTDGYMNKVLMFPDKQSADKWLVHYMLKYNDWDIAFVEMD